MIAKSSAIKKSMSIITIYVNASVVRNVQVGSKIHLLVNAVGKQEKNYLGWPSIIHLNERFIDDLMCKT